MFKEFVQQRLLYMMTVCSLLWIVAQKSVMVVSSLWLSGSIISSNSPKVEGDIHK